MAEIGGDRLENALEKFFNELVNKHVIQENEKEELQKGFGAKLKANYDNNVPQTLFTNKKERQKLLASIMSFLVVEKNPDLKKNPEFDFMLLLRNDIKPEQKKSFFKHLLLELKPKNKSGKTKAQEAEEENALDQQLDNFMKELDKTEKEREKEESDISPAFDTVAQVYEILYGQNYFGQVTLTSTAGQNTQSVNDDKPVTSWLQGLFGTLHKGRDITSQFTSSYVEASAESRLLGLGGLGEAAYEHIQSAHILHAETPTLVKR